MENDCSFFLFLFLAKNVVIISALSAHCSVQVNQLQNPDSVFETIIGLVVRLAEHGLIHCDFNEFNIMVCTSGLVSVFYF